MADATLAAERPYRLLFGCYQTVPESRLTCLRSADPRVPAVNTTRIDRLEIALPDVDAFSLEGGEYFR